jgi:hypothetical protein
VAGIGVIIFVATGLYEAYVPGRVLEVAGVAISRELIADDDAARHYVHVRLDDGANVRARLDGFVTVVPGDRVLLRQIETPLLGLHRYRYKAHVDPERNIAVPAERVTR